VPDLPFRPAGEVVEGDTMLNQVEAARFLQVLSRGRRLTELDAARALSSAARLFAADAWSTAGFVGMPRRPGSGAANAPVVEIARPPAV